MLKKAIETYLKGFRLNQKNYYPGINALTLSTVLDDLAQQAGTDSNDPEVEANRQLLPSLKGAVQFSLETAANQEANNPWVFLSLGDLTVCTAQDPKQVTRAYKKAIALSGKNKFALKSTLSQLELLDSLRFRPEYVKAGIAVLKQEIDKFESTAKASASPTY